MKARRTASARAAPAPLARARLLPAGGGPALRLSPGVQMTELVIGADTGGPLAIRRRSRAPGRSAFGGPRGGPHPPP